MRIRVISHILILKIFSLPSQFSVICIQNMFILLTSKTHRSKDLLLLWLLYLSDQLLFGYAPNTWQFMQGRRSTATKFSLMYMFTIA